MIIGDFGLTSDMILEPEEKRKCFKMRKYGGCKRGGAPLPSRVSRTAGWFVLCYVKKKNKKKKGEGKKEEADPPGGILGPPLSLCVNGDMVRRVQPIGDLGVRTVGE